LGLDFRQLMPTDWQRGLYGDSAGSTRDKTTGLNQVEG
jgi:hypothetical protein